MELSAPSMASSPPSAGAAEIRLRSVETVDMGGAWWCRCLSRPSGAPSTSRSRHLRRRRRRPIIHLHQLLTCTLSPSSRSRPSASSSSTPPSKQQQLQKMAMAAASAALQKESSSPASPFRFRLSPGRVSPLIDVVVSSPSNSNPSSWSSDLRHRRPHILHDYCCSPAAAAAQSGKLNSLLHRAGFLSPPPPLENSKVAKSSPTLLEMMREATHEPPQASAAEPPPPPRDAEASAPAAYSSSPPTGIDRRLGIEFEGSDSPELMLDLQLEEERVRSSAGGGCSTSRHFTAGPPASGDVRLVLCSGSGGGSAGRGGGGGGRQLRLRAHSQVLASRSPFLAARLSGLSSSDPPPDTTSTPTPAAVDVLQQQLIISDCDDISAYVETLRLMYYSDIGLRRRLLRENVCRVLAILKVSAAIAFDAGVSACLEYLEATPWAEEEEAKVVSVVSELKWMGRIGDVAPEEVLARLSIAAAAAHNDSGGGGESDLVRRLLHLVVEGTDEKGRRQMKGMVSKLMSDKGGGEETSRKGSIYEACNRCVDCLFDLYERASSMAAGGGGGRRTEEAEAQEERRKVAAQIIRCADSLQWLVDILIQGRIAEDFVDRWAAETELVALHGRVPISMGRYEVSRLTGRLCVAIGQGHVLAPRDTRFALVHNWLQPIIDDFGWMQRTCHGFDRRSVEDGISRTISTLPLHHQHSFIISWSTRFLAHGDDCPNLHNAFEIWWRRTFA